MSLFENEPFRDLDTILSRMSGRQRSGDNAMRIAMDAYRRGDNVWAHLDLPGVSPDSIDINLERNVLTVTADRTWDRREGDQYYVAERRRGTFMRQVHLGDGLDPDHIDADYRDGVLTLRIPVAERAQPRKITIKANHDALDT